MVKVSFNSTVIVRLTEEGRKVYKKYLEELKSQGTAQKDIDQCYAKVQSDGKLRLLLWEVMHIFGPETSLYSYLFEASSFEVDNCLIEIN